MRDVSRENEELFKLSNENLEWFKANYKSLRKDFDNQWVVIQNKRVVAKGSTFEEITEILKQPDRKTALVEFIDSKQLAMFF